VACLAVDDWELVAEADSRRVSAAGGAAALLTTSSLIIDGLSKTVSSVTKAIGIQYFYFDNYKCLHFLYCSYLEFKGTVATCSQEI
jgi:hypothetical protein